jgi:hypothetical protein
LPHRVRRWRAPRRPGVCATCGRRHDALPLAYGSDAPAAWGDGPTVVDEWELAEEQCVIGDERFLRAQLQIPVLGLDEPFSWGVWIAVGQDDFDRAAELWTTPGRECEPPYDGHLDTELPAALYGETLGLAVLLHTRPVGLRPLVELVDGKHPLGRDQLYGMTRERVRDIAELVHGRPPR